MSSNSGSSIGSWVNSRFLLSGWMTEWCRAQKAGSPCMRSFFVQASDFTSIHSFRTFPICTKLFQSNWLQTPLESSIHLLFSATCLGLSLGSYCFENCSLWRDTRWWRASGSLALVRDVIFFLVCHLPSITRRVSFSFFSSTPFGDELGLGQAKLLHEQEW